MCLDDAAIFRTKHLTVASLFRTMEKSRVARFEEYNERELQFHDVLHRKAQRVSNNNL